MNKNIRSGNEITEKLKGFLSDKIESTLIFYCPLMTCNHCNADKSRVIQHALVTHTFEEIIEAIQKWAGLICLKTLKNAKYVTRLSWIILAVIVGLRNDMCELWTRRGIWFHRIMLALFLWVCKLGMSMWLPKWMK